MPYELSKNIQYISQCIETTLCSESLILQMKVFVHLMLGGIISVMYISARWWKDKGFIHHR